MMSAITNSGIKFPRRGLTINLAPADIKKEGAGFDLPMAIGVLTACDLVVAENLSDYMMLGELSLDGSVLPVKGALPAAVKARELGFKRLIVPEENVTEAGVVNKLEVYGVKNLVEAIELVAGKSLMEPIHINTREIFASEADCFDFDFSEVKGQDSVKRAFEVACAGGHNLLMIGPPGAGKSMMAKRLPSILPPLSLGEALETTKIHSVAGKLKRGSMLMTRRPFRTPHHTISPVALVGGGNTPMPGEISLAHNGVLFLDEFPEFSRQVLEVMRQPIEDRIITISRAKYSVDYPASFMLVASMNPCPCGYYGHPTKSCTCLPGAVSRYMNRISGPLLDRIDIQIEIQPVGFDDMADRRPAETSASIRERVIQSRAIQNLRFKAEKGIYCNAQMNSRLLHQYAWPDEKGLTKLKERMERLNMSARAFDRILRVARTIADLDNAASLPTPAPSASAASAPGASAASAASAASGSSSSGSASMSSSSLAYQEALAAAAMAPITVGHIAEAIGYRSLDRGNYGKIF